MALLSEESLPLVGSLKCFRSGHGILALLVLLNLVGMQRAQWRQLSSSFLNKAVPAPQMALSEKRNVEIRAYTCPDTRDPSIHGDYSIPIHHWKLPGNPNGVELARMDRFPTSPDEPVADYSYSRFTESFYMDSESAIHFVIMSDRAGEEPNPKTDPLPALVNSLLLRSTLPIVMHLVTRYRIPWLDALDSPLFQVNYYNHERLGLLGNAFRLQKLYDFRSTHKSMPMPMVKLFFSLLPLPQPPSDSFSMGIQNILLIDDDINFYGDPAKLWRLFDPHRLALNCPEDARRIEKFYFNTTNNGHPSRYCNSGMVNLPVFPRRPHPRFGWTNDLMEIYFDATARMTTEYPKDIYLTADQDIYNRILADREDLIDFSPCQWHCDFNSCKRGDGPGCSNCPAIGKSENPEEGYCQTFHFVSGSYKFRKNYLEEQTGKVAPPDAGITDYTTLWHLNPLQTLIDSFLPRVTQNIPACESSRMMATKRF
eukprot:scaffold7453_cov177-Amphora_coffeaeformis.AAC.11